MREYNNRDKKTNDAELDPCIAAEVRMKKSFINSRHRRQLLMILVLVFFVLLLAVLLFLLFSKPVNNEEMETEKNLHNSVSAEDYVFLEKAVDIRYSSATDLPILHLSLTTAGIRNDQFSHVVHPEIHSTPSTSPVITEGTITRTIKDTLTSSPMMEIFPTNTTSTYTPTTNSAFNFNSTTITFPITTSITATTATTSISTTTILASSKPADIPVVSVKINRYSSLNTTNTTDDGFVNTSCDSYLKNGELTNGVYKLTLPIVGDFDTFCDMSTNNGGWTFIQRRINGDVYFSNRTWAEYENGFGDINSSFWLGLKKIRALVKEAQGNYLTLRIEINGDFCSDEIGCSNLPNGFWWGEWDFKIHGPSTSYTLSISPAVAGNLTEHTNMDRFYYLNNGKPFTTVDRDNDKHSVNCAQFRDFGGWWHNDCTYVALNGRYGDSSAKMRNLFWFFSSGTRPPITYYIKPKFTEMKVRNKK